jgi:hypothetical protein
MKYIQDEPIVDEFEEIWFNKDGKEILGENEKFYAKSLTRDGSTTYYVREFGGTLFDPTGTYSRKRFHPEEIKMPKVNKNVFDFYMMFLNTKNNIYLVRAERGRTNG